LKMVACIMPRANMPVLFYRQFNEIRKMAMLIIDIAFFVGKIYTLGNLHCHDR